MLYKSFVFENKTFTDRVVRSLEECKVLRSYVKQVKIKFFFDDYLSWADLIRIAALLLGLTKLELVNVCDLKPDVVRALGSLKHLVHFTFRASRVPNVRGSFHGAPLASLILGWKALTHVDLVCIIFEERDWMPARGPSGLTSLKVQLCNFTDAELK